MTVKMVRSRRTAAMTSFLLVDTKQFEQHTCLLAVSAEMSAVNATHLTHSHKSIMEI